MNYKLYRSYWRSRHIKNLAFHFILYTFCILNCFPLWLAIKGIALSLQHENIAFLLAMVPASILTPVMFPVIFINCLLGFLISFIVLKVILKTRSILWYGIMGIMTSLSFIIVTRLNLFQLSGSNKIISDMSDGVISTLLFSGMLIGFFYNWAVKLFESD